jgi:ribosomal protein S18 acetylase RimI-like enzyme
VVSVNVESSVVAPGADTYVDDAWTLKEHIRKHDGVLKQRRSFFEDAYRRSQVHCYHVDDDLAGFAAVRRDGYILFLATAPEHRGQGFGKRLVADVAEENSVVTCHARTSNEDALAFYEHIGFQIERRIDNYYEDGGDAYYLKLGDSAGFTEKLSRLMGR